MIYNKVEFLKRKEVVLIKKIQTLKREVGILNIDLDNIRKEIGIEEHKPVKLRIK